jgi:hypothetical protein
MGTEILVGGLWGAVLLYWLWTRRPAAADTVGLFHRELQVLERATPLRVAPANRLGPERPHDISGKGAPPLPLPPPVAAAAAVHRQAELRRRRRDVLSLLAAAMLVTLVAVVLSGSAVALAFQVCADLALGGYVLLLYGATRRRGRAYAQAFYLSGPVFAPAGRAPASDVARYRRAANVPRIPVPVSATRTGPMAALVPAPPAQYGDFDSYKRLALAEVR